MAFNFYDRVHAPGARIGTVIGPRPALPDANETLWAVEFRDAEGRRIGDAETYPADALVRVAAAGEDEWQFQPWLQENGVARPPWATAVKTGERLEGVIWHCAPDEAKARLCIGGWLL